MNSTITKNSLKMGGGVVALLASTLATAASADAINLTIGNNGFDTVSFGTDVGQSFINDPSGSGRVRLLNWTFGFADGSPINGYASLAATKTLNIYAGTGNGGSVVGSSSSALAGTLASLHTPTSSPYNLQSVTWTFANGGLELDTNATYTAAIANASNTLNYAFELDGNPYANGAGTGSDPALNGGVNGVNYPNLDIVFQANFSPTPVPFEFDPTGGIAVLGGGWLLRKHLLKKKANKG